MFTIWVLLGYILINSIYHSYFRFDYHFEFITFTILRRIRVDTYFVAIFDNTSFTYMVIINSVCIINFYLSNFPS